VIELHNVIVAIVNQRSADGALQQHIYVCCRCVACLNLSDLLMLSENNRLVAQEWYTVYTLKM
jgi:hypothetical protein